MSVQRDAPPWRSWTIEQWTAYRDRAAAYLATDPKWIVGPAVVRMAEFHIERLRAEQEAADDAAWSESALQRLIADESWA